MPAGLEIENANLTEGASVAGLDWLKQEVDAGPHRSARRPLCRRLRAQRRQRAEARLHRRLYRPRRLARPLCPAGRRDRGHVPARPLRPHRLRHGRYQLGAVRRAMSAAAHAARRRLRIGSWLAALAVGCGRGGRRLLALRRRPAAARPRRRAATARPWCSTARAGCCAPS